VSVLLTSTSAVAPQQRLNHDLANALEALAASGTPVGVVSNRPKPSWFDRTFTEVQFARWMGRQKGHQIAELGAEYDVPTHDFLVLGASPEDVQMAKNGKAVLISMAWLPDSYAAKYGISVTSPAELAEVVNLLSTWPGQWYFEATSPPYNVLSLSNISGKGVTAAQERWAGQIVATIKAGGPRLTALLTVAARSVLMSGLAPKKDLIFGLYPSSRSRNDDSEILSNLTQRVRTVTAKCQLARQGRPLFFRHRASAKRSSGASSNRTNPAGQLTTIHINPYYRGKLEGRHAIVFDDCTTYGVSFGVTAALLRKAGVASINCIALGKFGRQLRHYDIQVTSDPFRPLSPGDFTVQTAGRWPSHQAAENAAAQHALRKLV